MGPTGSHLPCIIPKVTAQRQIILHYDVVTQFAQKRGIGKKLLLTVRTVMLQEHVDMVAGDFNSAAWRRPCGSDRQPTSIIEESSADTNLHVPLGPTPLWRSGGVPGEWADVCVSSIIEETFANTNLPVPPGTHTVVVTGRSTGRVG